MLAHKKKRPILGALFALAIGLSVVGCGAGYSGGGGSSSSGGGSSCSTGYCLNNGQCCPGAYPNYTYGGHGYAAGCYASCPYVGDCGSSTQCF